jgi:hypothetical protein
MNVKIGAVLAVTVLLIGGGYALYSSFGKSLFSSSSPNNEASQQIVQDDIKAELDLVLGVLLTLHHVSLTDAPPSSPETVIVEELQESMNDLNKLKRLRITTENLSASKNEIISTTGRVLDMSTLGLILAYEKWIEYLRGVDINTLQVSEFQYQLALFQSSTHDVYLNLVEGASYLPMIVVKFSDNADESNTIDENLRDHFVAKTDRLFGDILIDDDRFYEKTKNRYAIAVLIRNYKEFFSSSN